MSYGKNRCGFTIEAIQRNSATATDRNAGDTLRYRWTQTAGPAVTMTGADSASMSFAGPSVTADTAVSFTVAVSDGSAEDSESVTVGIRNVNPPATTTPESRSGGALHWLALLLAPLAWVRRKSVAKNADLK